MSKSERQTVIPKILLVGASRGIGLAMTEELLRRGWHVIATVRNTQNVELHDLANYYPNRLSIEQLDMTETTQLKALHDRLAGQQLDALFINAGTANQNQSETIAEVSTQEFEHLMVTNALSPMRNIEMLQDLVSDRGLIGVMSSGQGSISNNEHGGNEVYRGTKAALNQYMRSYAARSTKQYPHRALLLLAPGWIRTELGGEGATFTLQETIPPIIDVIESKRTKPGLEYLDRFSKPVSW